MNDLLPGCARCPFNAQDRLCRKEDGKMPPFCPTQNKTRAVEKAMEEFKKPEILKFATQASIQEGEGYGDKEKGYAHVKPTKPRIMEIMEFAHKMNYKRLGLAFCMGLVNEARAVEKLLSTHGFEVISAVCKVGRTPKESINVRDDQKIRIGCFEPMCNPVAQAFILNEEKTEFNVVMGLCVGHDSLFLKYAEAFCTIFAVKDRLLGHNPLAAIYTLDSYYRSLK